MTTTNYVVDFFDALWDDVNSCFNVYTTSTGTSSYVYNNSFPPFDFFVNDETKDMVLEFAVAGIPKEKIDLSVDGDYLILKIDKSDRSKEGFRFVQQGIKSSSVKKKFYIPFSKYDLENIGIQLEEGILKIFIPARESLKVRKLAIK